MIIQPRVRKRPRRNGRGLAFAVMLAIAGALAAACSTGGAGTGNPAVASLPGHTSTAQAGQPLTQAGSDQDMVNFTRCMRSHGVQMSDPYHRPGHAGLSIDLPAHDAATNGAYSACTHFIAKIIQAKQAGAATVAASQLAALTRYARCMRSHDIGMLDPTPTGQLSLGQVPGITSDPGRYSPQFRAADSACRHLLPAGVHDDGTGP
jgi:hypothetical protein